MFWKKLLMLFCAIALSVSAFFFNQITTVSAVQKENAPPWAGTWEAVAGEIMTVREKDGVLDILGKDRASIYSCTGIIEGSGEQAALCYGNGVNHEINQRFIYRSQLKLSANGQEIEESWEIAFANGKEMKWLKGKGNYKRKKTVTK